MNFVKYILLMRQREKGTLSREDEAMLNTYEQSKAGQDDRRIWEASGQYKKSFQADAEAGLARFRKRLQEEEKQKPSPLRARKTNRRQWLVAASLAAILSLTWLVWQANNDPTVEWKTLAATDDIQKIELTDGTLITLNKGARLTYPSAFTNLQDRRVELSGEAYFKVSKMLDKPFIIETTETEVEVLGTAFNLRAHPDEVFTEVEVEEGKVALRERKEKEAKDIILEAKECGRYIHKGELVKEASPMLNRLAWHTHRLRFLDTPLKGVIPMIERYYDIRIEGSASLNEIECPITGDWRNGELQSVFSVIEALTPLRMELVSEGVYRIEGQGCQ